jgi:hypothetical protein
LPKNRKYGARNKNKLQGSCCNQLRKTGDTPVFLLLFIPNKTYLLCKLKEHKIDLPEAI